MPLERGGSLKREGARNRESLISSKYGMIGADKNVWMFGRIQCVAVIGHFVFGLFVGDVHIIGAPSYRLQSSLLHNVLVRRVM